MGDNAQDLREVKGLTGQAADEEEWDGIFRQGFSVLHTGCVSTTANICE